MKYIHAAYTINYQLADDEASLELEPIGIVAAIKAASDSLLPTLHAYRQ